MCMEANAYSKNSSSPVNLQRLFQLLFKFLWLLTNDFSETVENILCLKKLRINALYIEELKFVLWIIFFKIIIVFFLLKSRH